MNFEMSAILNNWDSYEAIQLTADELKSIQAGIPVKAEVKFLQGAVINIQIGNSESSYPSDWPKPNITSSDNAECPIPGCPDEKS